MYSKISWDWKESPDCKQLRNALKKFGIFVYDDPDFCGSDTYGYIFSDKKMSKDDLLETSDFEEDEE